MDKVFEKISFDLSGSQRVQGSSLKNVGLQISKMDNLGFYGSASLHSRAFFGQIQHFCPGSKQRKGLGSRLHNKNLGAPGLQ